MQYVYCHDFAHSMVLPPIRSHHCFSIAVNVSGSTGLMARRTALFSWGQQENSLFPLLVRAQEAN